jgi:hypothetical protein
MWTNVLSVNILSPMHVAVIKAVDERNCQKFALLQKKIIEDRRFLD